MRIITSALFIGAGLLFSPAFAQEMWRCPGNHYTNSKEEAKRLGDCKPVMASISVIPGADVVEKETQETVTPNPPAEEAQPQGNGEGDKPVEPKPDPEAEKRKAQMRKDMDQKNKELSELEKEYKNGEPDKMGPEHRNHQKYLDRVERLKSEIDARKKEIQKLKQSL